MSDPRRTRAWGRLRTAVGLTLPQPCGRCGLPVFAADDWDLGHPVDLAAGGHPWAGRPEHRHCNRVAGGMTRVSRPAALGPSRRW